MRSVEKLFVLIFLTWLSVASAIVFLSGALHYLHPALIFHWIIARSSLLGVVGEIDVEICFSREERGDSLKVYFNYMIFLIYWMNAVSICHFLLSWTTSCFLGAVA